MQSINDAPQWLQNLLKEQSEAILSLADHVRGLQSGKPDGKDQKPGTDPLKDIQSWAKSRQEEAKQWKKQQQ